MENFFEEYSNLLDDIKEKRKYMLCAIFSVSSIVLAIAFFIFFMLDLLNAPDFNTGRLITWVLVYLLPIAAFIYLAIMFLKKKWKCVLEFDYTLANGLLIVSEINNRVRRRELLQIDCKSIAKVGICEGNDYLKLKSMPDIEIIKANANDEPQNSDYLYYIQTNSNEERKAYIIDVSTNFMKELTYQYRSYIFADEDSEDAIFG